MVAGCRIGSGDREHPVRMSPARDPGLLPVEYVIVALAGGPRSHASKIAAGVGFGPSLSPYVISSSEPEQMTALLLIGSERDQGRTEHGEPVLVHADGSAGSRGL